MDMEREYGAALVQTFKGYDFVENAFFEFMIETIDLAAQGAFWGQLNDDDKRYVTIYLTFISVFRRFRAVATLKNYGHPVHGFALLRDLAGW